MSQTLQGLLFILCVRLHFLIMNLRHLPTFENFPQDIIAHIQVVHRLQVKSMHSLIRVWFLNPFRCPSSQSYLLIVQSIICDKN